MEVEFDFQRGTGFESPLPLFSFPIALSGSEGRVPTFQLTPDPPFLMIDSNGGDYLEKRTYTLTLNPLRRSRFNVCALRAEKQSPNLSLEENLSDKNPVGKPTKSEPKKSKSSPQPEEENEIFKDD